jgi:hypothetical protein
MPFHNARNGPILLGHQLPHPSNSFLQIFLIYFYIEFSLNYWDCQVGSKSCCCLDLLYQVIRIYIFNTILYRMVVWITIFIHSFVILNLDSGGNSLLTEGAFIPSVTPCDDTRLQVKAISMDNFTQRLDKTQRWGMISGP